MVPIRASTPPKKKSLVPNLMEKGLMVLWKVASRAQQAPERKLHPKQRSPSKSAQAISNYARRMVQSWGGGRGGRPPPAPLTGFSCWVKGLRGGGPRGESFPSKCG